MQVHVIDSYDALAPLEANWNALYRIDPEAQFFLSWTWLARVLREFPGRWRVLAVKPDDAGAGYVGLFPTRIKTIWSESRRMFHNEIHMAGRLLWAQYTGFLCHPEWEEQTIESFAEQLKRMHWSRMCLNYFRTSDRHLRLLMNHFCEDQFRISFGERTINKGKTNNLVCPYIDLPDDYEAYLVTKLSSNARQKLRRFTRIVENSPDLSVTTMSSETIERDLDVLTRLWIQKWVSSKGKRAESLARTYRQILWYAFESDSLHMRILWRGDAPLGALASLVDWEKRSLFFIVSARDESRQEPFIGWILHSTNIRWAIENGIAIYDFCHGDEPYKYSFGASNLQVKYVTVKTRSRKNLHGTLDPACLGDVMMQARRFLEIGRGEEAAIARQQIDAATPPDRRGLS